MLADNPFNQRGKITLDIINFLFLEEKDKREKFRYFLKYYNSIR